MDMIGALLTERDGYARRMATAIDERHRARWAGRVAQVDEQLQLAGHQPEPAPEAPAEPGPTSPPEKVATPTPRPARSPKKR